ncbi:HVA22-like protein k isoform X2 [Mangifera indica]|uniref:HVA22-like protein k isoform X2 n=1 Tax=Mangifera indica TaxID=29780 RepID=UPI001CFC2094|nr:HVA22-like protein k isoform X2 [Mangifera indica]
MDALGSTLTNKVGLQLLLCPLGSNVVIRTACCSVGIALPVYSTFKAIERKDQDDQQKWLIYWAVYGSFSIVEVFSDKLLSWFPMYYHLKFAFLVWLQLPSAEGARQLYTNHLRPFLLRHQARVDKLVGFGNHQMVRVFSTHQAVFQFAKTVLMKIMGTGDLPFRGTSQQEHNEIEGPPSPISETQSDHEE